MKLYLRIYKLSLPLAQLHHYVIVKQIRTLIKTIFVVVLVKKEIQTVAEQSTGLYLLL